ncbi:Os12g0227050 [Oryza sativa Japonica Group]|uniref:Os12g0227050 protein n=1 Tax=Oryza sativa subsp. japonica TaxID=39947 RepID=A0A0P0Y8A5_ORYSJ|nr:hypothetical protein EE612_058511 [Oryza sativa]BAT16406.1 Os12g0227050 [Oryza sativa Japonica Group]
MTGHPVAHVRIAGDIQVLHHHRLRPCWDDGQRWHFRRHHLHVILRQEPRHVPLQDHPLVARRRRHCCSRAHLAP